VQIQKYQNYLIYIHHVHKQRHERSDRCRQKGLCYRLQIAARDERSDSVRNKGAEHFVACFMATVALSASLIKRYQPHITYYYYYYYY
jgi:hypothetical protein